MGAQSTIRIVSPEANAVLDAAEPIRVTVAGSVGVTLASVTAWIVPMSVPPQIVESAPFDIAVRVPPGVLGRQTIMVSAADSQGSVLRTSTSVIIKTTALAVSIEAEPKRLLFAKVDDQVRSISVLASFTDGSSAHVETSPEIQFAVVNSRVAATTADGKVRPVGLGTTILTASLAGFQFSIPVSVGVFALPGDLTGDGSVDQSDLQLLRNSLNTAATGTGDPRDFDGDGQIDDRDFQALQRLCTFPACAGRAIKSSPIITWPAPDALTYGSALTAAQLNATATVPGTFAYSPPSGTILGSGSRTLSVRFIPADLAAYLAATATVKLQVNKAQPAIGWPKPVDIVFGTALGVDQLKASSNVPGVFTYSPALGTILTVGNEWVLSASFQPTDDVNYSLVTASTKINVVPKPPPPLPTYTLSATPAAVLFDQLPGGARPAGKQIFVTVATKDARLFYSATASDPWISLQQTGISETNLGVSVDTSDMAHGLHAGSVTLTSPQATNSPFLIPVRVYIGAVVESFVSSASFEPGAAAPGSIVTIFGHNLSTSTLSASVPLPKVLGGASVKIDGADVPLFYVSPGQINLQVPPNLKPGPAKLVVTANNTTATYEINIAATFPGIFRIGDYAAAVNPSGAVNGTDAGAPAGSFVSVYMTGQGEVAPPVPAGQVAPADPLSSVVAATSASIGGSNAEVLFAGLAPGFVGLLQVNLRVPASLQTGDYPVIVKIGGVATSTAASAPKLHVVNP